jgi:hypothetical protein
VRGPAAPPDAQCLTLASLTSQPCVAESMRLHSRESLQRKYALGGGPIPEVIHSDSDDLIFRRLHPPNRSTIRCAANLPRRLSRSTISPDIERLSPPEQRFPKMKLPRFPKTLLSGIVRLADGDERCDVARDRLPVGMWQGANH